jgi:hypothetical protein
MKLLAVGEASRQVGGYVNNLATRYLILMVAFTIFLGAFAYGTLATYWKLTSLNWTPVQAALGVACGLLLIAFLMALLAYGTTQASKPEPLLENNALSPMPAIADLTPEDVGRHIERAVALHGAGKVVAFAAAGGIIAGMLSRRLPRT